MRINILTIRILRSMSIRSVALRAVADETDAVALAAGSRDRHMALLITIARRIMTHAAG